MADFRIALDRVLANEGLYNNLKQDKGGETYCGIARNPNPDWEGWKAVDKYKAEFGEPAYGGRIAWADKAVASFYNAHFWKPIGGDTITNQNHANILFDIAVNCGVRKAGLLLQEVLRDCFGHIDITLDGIIGTQTIIALNKHSGGEKEVFGMLVSAPYLLMVQLTAVRMKHYARLAKGGDAWAIPGWTARSFSFLGSK